jgi:hypothetical protein
VITISITLSLGHLGQYHALHIATDEQHLQSPNLSRWIWETCNQPSSLLTSSDATSSSGYPVFW